MGTDPPQQLRVAGFQLPDASDHGPEHSPTDQGIERGLDLLRGEQRVELMADPLEHLRTQEVGSHRDAPLANPMVVICGGLAMTNRTLRLLWCRGKTVGQVLELQGSGDGRQSKPAEGGSGRSHRQDG